MTIVRIGRKSENSYMEFEFPNETEAFVFYCGAKSGYREDDLVITMTEEGEE